MSTQQILLERHIRPLHEYYRSELPHVAQARLAADMDGFLIDHIKSWAIVGRIGICGADLWLQLVTLCYQLLIRSGAAGALEVAESFARQTPEVLESALGLGDRMCFYDMLKHLFFMAGIDFPDYRPFDALVVRPYAAWIRSLAGAAAAAPATRRLPTERRLRIGYLCNYPAMMAPGRIGAPLFISMILDHQEHLEHDCIVYPLGAPQAGWQEFMAGLGVAVTPVPFPGYAVHGDCGFPEILAQIRGDRPDVLLTDDNMALPAYLYEHRVAPVQAYVAMGMPFWGLRHLDYVMLGSNSADACPDLPAERKISQRYGYNARLLDGTNDPAAIAAARADIPPHHRVAGTFSRFVRISPDYLSTIGRILADNPDVTVMIGGNGDPERISAFLAQCPQRDRIRFFDHDVDVFAYGRAIDFFLDTLPLASGNVCREVQYFGKPVVSLQHENYVQYLAELRDPELVCADIDGYVRVASRLIREPDYLRARSAKAREIGAAEARSGNHAALLRELLARASA